MTGPARIWLPAEKGVPRPLLCESCGARFRIEQIVDWQRHVVECSARHEEDEREASPRSRGDYFSPPDGMVIPDLESWVSKHRADIISGRKKL